MASADVALNYIENDRPLTNPWPWSLGGLFVTGNSLIWFAEASESLAELRALVILVGVILAGVGIFVHSYSDKSLLGGAEVLAAGALAFVLGALAVNWNSIRLLLGVLAAVTVLAAVIVLFSNFWRKVILSIIIVLHFCGILSTVLAAPPGPWLANLVWTYIYRPYLQFIYLNNAYHFYAPEPGPAYQFWFCIKYTEDDSKPRFHWKKVPKLDGKGWPQYTLALQYQKRLALTALVAQAVNQFDSETARKMGIRREQESLYRDNLNMPIIPRHPAGNVPQIVVPSAQSLHILSSFSRHVAREFEDEHPDATVEFVKVYRVEHMILNAADFEARRNPNAPATYLPYYWGRYDRDGKLQDAERDPYLYWCIPILGVHPDQSVYFKRNELILREKGLLRLPWPDRPRLPNDEDDHYNLDIYRACYDTETNRVKYFNYVILHAEETGEEVLPGKWKKDGKWIYKWTDIRWIRHHAEKGWEEPGNKEGG